MTNPVLVKRSAVPGKEPTLAQLSAGELGMNTADARLFFSTGTDIVEVSKVGHTHAAPTLDSLANVATSAKADGDLLSWNGSSWTNSHVADGSFSALLSSWTLDSGDRYYTDVVHSLGTQSITVSFWDTSTNALVIPDAVIATNASTLRVYVIGNSRTLRCVVLANGQAIAAGGSTPSSVLIQDEGVPIAGTPHTTLNFSGSAVTVSDSGGGVATISVSNFIIRAQTFSASSLDSPNNADWAVNALAAAIVDPTNSALTVRQFSQTTEQGVGFCLTIPEGATSLTIKTKGRAQTAPGVASVVQPRVYVRALPDNAAVGAWGSHDLANIDIPTNAFFQYDTQTVSLASLGMAAGNMYQCELTRATSVSGGTQLPGNWYLIELTIEFS